MVQIVKDGVVLLLPMTAYEADYKNYGWRIVKEEQKVEKQSVSSETIVESKVEEPKKEIKKVNNSNKKK